MQEIKRVEISKFLQRPLLYFHKSISSLVWLVRTFIWTARLPLVYLLYFWHSWLLDEIALWVKLPCSSNFFNTAPLVWCRHTWSYLHGRNKLPNSQAVLTDTGSQLQFHNHTQPASWGFIPFSLTSNLSGSSHVLTLSSRSTLIEKLGSKIYPQYST